MTRGDELKDLIIFGRQMNWQYQLSDFTDEALKSIQRSVNIARKELMDSLEMRDMLQLEELNNLTFGIQTALHDDIAAAAQIAGKASYVEYNNILSFDGKISDTTGAAVGFTDVAVSASQLKSMIVDTPVGGALLSDWVSTSFDAALVQQFKEEFGAGVLKGESIKKLVGRIPVGMDMLGREMVSLTRTYIADINNRAAGAVYQANSDIIKEEQWSAALEVSGRGSSTCLTCAGMHGRKFPIDKPHPRPPQHINCRCFMVPLTVSWRDLGLNIDELEEAAQPYTVRTPGAIGAGRRGTILEAGQFRGNFEEFLKSQPEKYSIELLGANRYRLLQEGKIRFSDLVDKDGNLVLLQKGVDGKFIGLMPSQKYVPSQITPNPVLKVKTEQEILKQNLYKAESEIYSRKTEKAYVFDAKGNEVLSKSGKKDRVSFTLDEAEKFKGGIFTHNHPGGHSFSPADIKVLINQELAEMRAVTPEHIHRISVTAEMPTKAKANKIITSEYKKHEDNTYASFRDKIKKGEMTIKYADAEHHHVVWTEVSKNIAWINYKREEWKPLQ